MQLLSAQVPGQFGAREQKSFAMHRSSSWSVMFGLDSAQAHFDQNSEFPLRRTLQLASLPWPKGCCCTRVLLGIGGYITPNSQKSIYFFSPGHYWPEIIGLSASAARPTTANATNQHGASHSRAPTRSNNNNHRHPRRPTHRQQQTAAHPHRETQQARQIQRMRVGQDRVKRGWCRAGRWSS